MEEEAVAVDMPGAVLVVVVVGAVDGEKAPRCT